MAPDAAVVIGQKMPRLRMSQCAREKSLQYGLSGRVRRLPLRGKIIMFPTRITVGVHHTGSSVDTAAALQDSVMQYSLHPST